MAYQQGSGVYVSNSGFMTSPNSAFLLTAFKLISSPNPVLLCYRLEDSFFINQWYSQHTERNPTTPSIFCLNKKEGFNFNIAKLLITKQVSSKNYSYNIYIYVIFYHNQRNL